MEHVLRALLENGSKQKEPEQLAVYERLKWNIDKTAEQSISSSCHSASLLSQNINLEVYEFSSFGKDLIKSHRFSPDAFIQVALQLAYLLVHDSFTATYSVCLE